MSNLDGPMTDLEFRQTAERMFRMTHPGAADGAVWRRSALKRYDDGTIVEVFYVGPELHRWAVVTDCAEQWVFVDGRVTVDTLLRANASGRSLFLYSPEYVADLDRIV